MGLGLELAMQLWLHTVEPTGQEIVDFAATDPVDLRGEAAHDNLVAARIAGDLYGIPPEVLLAVAWHESRYQPGTQTKEPGGYAEDNRYHRHRVSCGVMTPIPQTHCSPDELTLEGGYMRGAAHLRMYVDVYGSIERALVAYAGGGGSIRYPRAGWRAWRSKRSVLRQADLIRPRPAS